MYDHLVYTVKMAQKLKNWHDQPASREKYFSVQENLPMKMRQMSAWSAKVGIKQKRAPAKYKEQEFRLLKHGKRLQRPTKKWR